MQISVEQYNALQDRIKELSADRDLLIHKSLCDDEEIVSLEAETQRLLERIKELENVQKKRRPMKKSLLVLAILCFVCVTGLAKDRAWREGKLLDMSRERYTTHGSSQIHGEFDGNGEFNGYATGSSSNHTIYWFRIEEARYIYVASYVPWYEFGFRINKQPKVTVNAPIKFAIDGDKAYILDDAGREHKLRVEKRVLKN